VDDPYDLARFVDAQALAYDRALAEIGSGHKRSHWMWYVFPQLAGLGLSAMSVRFAIGSLDEARAYLRHPVLGPRLQECFDALLRMDGRSAHDIFGSPDDLKLRSCATLFAEIAPPDSVFARVLDRYFDGRRDERTFALLPR
jgi:uncharacterized protein (DUF1810 family)